jgi:Zn-finger nucleic acid-binding protein
MLQCPVDGTELRISQKNGVEIDYCPRCRGVWLDRGELEKLISQSLADEQARYGDLYAAGGAPKRKNEEYYSEPPREVRRNQRPYEYDDDDLEYNLSLIHI